MDLVQALTFAGARRQGVLATIRSGGRPQLSNLVYVLHDGVARISVTDTRAKVKNLRRDPRASLYVPGDSFWAYVVLEGTVELSPVAGRLDDPVVEELIAIYREVQGEHPDWEEFRQAMVDDHRMVARFTAERAYGIVPS